MLRQQIMLRSTQGIRRNFLALIFCSLVSLAWGGPAFPQKVIEYQGIRFCLIPAGVYLLGSPASEPGRYAHEPLPYPVSLPAFYISDTEITNAQYSRFLKATRRPPPLYWQDGHLNGPDHPVVGVTWYDAVAFAEWLTQTTGVPHRLPTEVQWEAAARGGLVGQPYPWGSQPPHDGTLYRANYYPSHFDDDGFRFTSPVRSFPPNGYGLFDMAGNVAEWCQDSYTHSRTQTVFGPKENRILKGGSWYSRARDLRCAARQLAPPSTADGFIGFRVVRLHP